MSRTIYHWQFSRFFGGHWPMFPTPTASEEECRAERRRADELGQKRYTVVFDLGGVREYMYRGFWTVTEIVAYMRRFGWCATDIESIWERDWEFNREVETWLVRARDDNYGYIKRWYFPTEQAAEAFADSLGSQWNVRDIHQTTRRIRFSVPFSNMTRIPFNTR